MLDRCYYHWDVIAALRHNKSYDLFFSGYILICFGIVMEGIIRFCPHYFGSGMITLSIVVWVRAWGRVVGSMGLEHGVDEFPVIFTLITYK